MTSDNDHDDGLASDKDSADAGVYVSDAGWPLLRALMATKGKIVSIRVVNGVKAKKSRDSIPMCSQSSALEKNKSSVTWWFPVIPDEPSKRLALGVPLKDGETMPTLTGYADRLAIRFQDLIDRAGKKRAREAIEDLLTGAENVLMSDDPDSWGELIVETDAVQMLMADATDEMLEPVTPLDPETQAQLQKAAEQASLRQILALI